MTRVKFLAAAVIMFIVMRAVYAEEQPVKSAAQNPYTNKQPFKSNTISFGAGDAAAMSLATYRLSSNLAEAFGAEDAMDRLQTDFGVYIFFDMIYAEISAGLLSGGIDNTNKDVKKADGYQSLSSITMRFNVLAKYPVRINPLTTVFPALGLGYELFLSTLQDAKEGLFRTSGNYSYTDPLVGTETALAALSVLWFKAGAGFDVTLGGRWYFRGGVLYGVRLNSKMETYLIESIDGIESIFGQGLEIKAALGYRL
ncbi:MAG: hypothetical protein LBC77_04740 [Spirochaetaceae bacterium]|nr:hypothetical protein [Spirochaetaceae bacterium]